MKIGLVGKPSVGKSSLFKAMTLIDVPTASYPFTTIDPNVGVGFVRVEDPGPEFGVTSNPRYGFIAGKYRFVPVEVIDVAGLVPGAHEGKGLGNKFLDDLRQADALILVVDASGKTNEKGEELPDASYEPYKDIDFLIYELEMWILNILERNWNKFSRLDVQKIKPKYEILADLLSGLKISIEDIKQALIDLGLEEKPMQYWSDEEKLNFAKKIRALSKPLIVAANKADTEKAYENIQKMKELYPDMVIIPTSAEAEFALRKAAQAGLIEYVPGESDFKIIDESKLSEQQKKALEFIRKNVLEKYGSTGVQKLLDVAVFDVLKYIAVFPGGVNKLADKEGRVLPDCFLMPQGSTALDFAYKIHQDFGKNFIKAVDVRTKKLLGKDYALKHRDVIEIVAGRG